MSAKQLAYAGNQSTNQSSAPAETAFAVLGTMPLAILAIEAVIGGILFLVSVLFFATIFFAFVGFILLYLTLWIAVFFNAFGAAVSLLTLLAGRRYVTGKVFGVSGLLIHAVLLGAGIYGLASIHLYLAQARGPSQQPGTYGEMRPAEAWPPIGLEEGTQSQSEESLLGEESNDIKQSSRAD